MRALLTACGTILLWGCGAGQMFRSPSPTLAELEGGAVHVYREHGRGDVDIYKVTYSVDSPLDMAWRTPAEVADWIGSAEMIADISPISTVDDDGQHFLVRWKQGNAQEIVIRRDQRKKSKVIDISVVAQSRAVGQWGHCTIEMRRFLEESTLVEVKVEVLADVFSRFLDLLLTPITLVVGSSAQAQVRQFWEDLAMAHRGASRESDVSKLGPGPASSPLGSAH